MCVCGFCSVSVCVCVDFVMCGCVCACVGFVMCVSMCGFCNVCVLAIHILALFGYPD